MVVFVITKKKSIDVLCEIYYLLMFCVKYTKSHRSDWSSRLIIKDRTELQSKKRINDLSMIYQKDINMNPEMNLSILT